MFSLNHFSNTDLIWKRSICKINLARLSLDMDKTTAEVLSNPWQRKVNYEILLDVSYLFNGYLKSISFLLLLQMTLMFFFFYYNKGCDIFIKCWRPLCNLRKILNSLKEFHGIFVSLLSFFLFCSTISSNFRHFYSLFATLYPVAWYCHC